MKKIFLKNWKLYMMEALGLGIFMVSACFFGALFESGGSIIHRAVADPFERLVLTGLLMGLTALFIFYSPVTSPSGSHINPAVTLAFFRLGRMHKWDALFYIIFQFTGGTLAVYLMTGIMGTMLTAPPVNLAITIPLQGVNKALGTEFITAFLMMMMVLFTSAGRLSKYTRIIAACMVCIYVILAGPVSGFGMNPARSFASALPANTWTAWRIYMLAPVSGMLAAAEVFLVFKKKH